MGPRVRLLLSIRCSHGWSLVTNTPVHDAGTDRNGVRGRQGPWWVPNQLWPLGVTYPSFAVSPHGFPALFHGHSISIFTFRDAARSTRRVGEQSQSFIVRAGLAHEFLYTRCLPQAAPSFPDILLVGGVVVNADGASKRDVLISDGLVIALAKDLEV